MYKRVVQKDSTVKSQLLLETSEEHAESTQGLIGHLQKRATPKFHSIKPCLDAVMAVCTQPAVAAVTETFIALVPSAG